MFRAPDTSLPAARGIASSLIVVFLIFAFFSSNLAGQGDAPLVIEEAGEPAELWVNRDGHACLGWLDLVDGAWSLETAQLTPEGIVVGEAPQSLPIPGDIRPDE
ncbi:MAG: hypothetical protein AAFX50_10725, partial [Acidobacteriota bacterium]